MVWESFLFEVKRKKKLYLFFNQSLKFYPGFRNANIKPERKIVNSVNFLSPENIKGDLCGVLKYDAKIFPEKISGKNII